MGFFDKEELGNKQTQRNKKDNCYSCGLYKNCISPKMPITGEGKKGIFVLAEGPGNTEDKQNKQLVGTAGQLLRKKMRKFGISLDRDCWKMNAINCRSIDAKGNNRTPNTKEINACRQRVWKEINRLKPKAIFLFGLPAFESFLGHRWKGTLGAMNKWRGWAIPDRETGAWVMPMYHPSYVQRSKRMPVIETIFEQDLKKAIFQVSAEFPKYIPEQDQVTILEGAKLESQLRKIYRAGMQLFKSKPMLMAFDYECTGLKPHAKGHRIVCASICVRPSESYAFKFPLSTGALKWFIRLLKSEQIRKTAQHMKFENSWTEVILKIKIKNWYWCSMLGSHVLKNTEGITGLKFQIYVNFGLIDYSSHLEHHLRGEKNNANSFNNIDKIPIDELLLYCGIDSLGQYRLAQKQMRQLNYAN